MMVNIIVNLPGDSSDIYDIPIESRNISAVERLIAAAVDLHPTWTSMVVTFTNPELKKERTNG